MSPNECVGYTIVYVSTEIRFENRYEDEAVELIQVYILSNSPESRKEELQAYTYPCDFCEITFHRIQRS
ncbi:MAG: hypothetical protein AYK19_04740 [Theionarchaea archaeon DG-70-1]|nr:MAG: hypothetical protein AYK19_04740 [Theionarchaea archaeon DG-70-1]